MCRLAKRIRSYKILVFRGFGKFWSRVMTRSPSWMSGVRFPSPAFDCNGLGPWGVEPDHTGPKESLDDPPGPWPSPRGAGPDRRRRQDSDRWETAATVVVVAHGLEKTASPLDGVL